MLVVTPKPKPLESLMGYVLRLTEANGYPSTSYVLGLLGWDPDRPVGGGLDAGPLQAWAGLKHDDAVRLTTRGSQQRRSTIRLLGNALLTYEVRGRSPKVCPLCVAADGYCSALWDLTQAAACPRHGVVLVSTCPDCQKPLRWSRRKVAECKCGSDIRNWPTQPASEASVELMRLFEIRLCLPSTTDVPPPSLSHLAHLSLAQLCKLTWVLSGTVQAQVGQSAAGKSREACRDRFNEVAQILVNWPHNFHRFLQARFERLVVGRPSLPPFGHHFSWLVVRLCKNGADPAAFRFMLEEAMRFGAHYWPRSSLGRHVPPAIACLCRWGYIDDASDMLRIHPKTVWRMVADGILKTSHTGRTSKRATLIDLDHARQLNFTRFPAVSLRDAARQIGVSIECFRAMRELGIYSQAHKPIFPNALTHEDVTAFREKLATLASGKRKNGDVGLTTLGNAFVDRKLSPVEKARVFGWLIAHPEQAVGRMRVDAPGTSGIQVRAAHLDELLTEMRGAQTHVIVVDAARQIGCSGATVTALRRAHHLQGVKAFGRLMVCKQSLQLFDQEYESLHKIARRAGVPIKRVYARADFDCFTHLRVKSAQYTTTFVLRQHAATAEREFKRLA